MTRPIRFLVWKVGDPDLYMDYYGLSDPFTTRVPIGISNAEAIDLYFRSTLVAPPPEYTNYTTDLGLVAAGKSAFKVGTFDRSLPTVKVTDALTMRIEAYRDSAYTDFYGSQDLSFKYYLFDYTTGTLVDYTDFDDGTLQAWSVVAGTAEVSSVVYLSAPYSCRIDRFDSAIEKSWTIGVVTEAYFVMHLYSESYGYPKVEVNTVLKLNKACRPPPLNLYRIVFLLTPDAANTVRITNTSDATTDYNIYVDDLYVVTF